MQLRANKRAQRPHGGTWFESIFYQLWVRCSNYSATALHVANLNIATMSSKTVVLRNGQIIQFTAGGT